MKPRWYELRLTLPGRPPFRQVFSGEDLEAAIGVAASRFPQAEIDVPAPSAKAELVRSRNGPKVTRREIQRLLKCQSSQPRGNES